MTIPPGASVAASAAPSTVSCTSPNVPASLSGSESATVPRTSESGAGVGAPSNGAARSSRSRPAPNVVSAPGAPMSSAWAVSRSRTRCATEPGPPAAATSPHSSAAAPPTWGVAHDVPPQALTASDSGSPGVISTFVGAAMSGLRRPSSVGPSDEYDSGRSDVTSNAPTEKEPRASPGVGELEAVIRVTGARSMRQ